MRRSFAVSRRECGDKGEQNGPSQLFSLVPNIAIVQCTILIPRTDLQVTVLVGTEAIVLFSITLLPLFLCSCTNQTVEMLKSKNLISSPRINIQCYQGLKFLASASLQCRGIVTHSSSRQNTVFQTRLQVNGAMFLLFFFSFLKDNVPHNQGRIQVRARGCNDEIKKQATI